MQLRRKGRIFHIGEQVRWMADSASQVVKAFGRCRWGIYTDNNLKVFLKPIPDLGYNVCRHRVIQRKQSPAWD